MDIKLPLNELHECRKSEKGADISTVVLDLEKFLSPQPHCLTGRATAVVRATGSKPDKEDVKMVCKVYHPEVQRRNEGTVMDIVQKIAATNGPEMAKHLPTKFFNADIPGCTTHRIRSMIGIDWRGHRTTRIIGMKELQEITTLTTGESFLKAWLEVVTCTYHRYRCSDRRIDLFSIGHAFLWKNHVEHGDPSLSNMMYDPETKCGVLTDLDLVLLQWELRIIGTDRTGTIPFMALELLSRHYWEGKLKRYYHHELESFLWMIPFLFLSYNNGERKPNKYIDAWRTSNYDVCREKKNDFRGNTLLDAQSTIQPDYKSFWTVVHVFISDLDDILSARRSRHNHTLFGKSMTLQDVMADKHRTDSDAMWESFIKALKNVIKIQPLGDEFSDALEKLNSVKPDFIDLSDEQKVVLRQKFENDGN